MIPAVTVAVVAKKLLELLASNKEGRKFLGYVIGIALFIVLLPLIVLVALFGWMSGDGASDIINRDNIIAQMPAEQQQQIAYIDSVCDSIEATFTSKGLTENDAKKATAIYISCLSGHESEATFYTDLADCFLYTTETESVYVKITAKYGVIFTADDIAKLDELYGVTPVRYSPPPPDDNAIDVSAYADPSTKNVADLVLYALNAYESGWGYVSGTYGSVLTESLLTAKISQYPDKVGVHESTIRELWLGKRTADCIGLIKGYSWYEVSTGSFIYQNNGMPDIGADTIYASATVTGTIDTLPETPGLAVWYEGHIGIYVGGGYVVHAANTNVGVIKTKVSDSPWTHWLQIPYISYGG